MSFSQQPAGDGAKKYSASRMKYTTTRAVPVHTNTYKTNISQTNLIFQPARGSDQINIIYTEINIHHSKVCVVGKILGVGKSVCIYLIK